MVPYSTKEVGNAINDNVLRLLLIYVEVNAMMGFMMPRSMLYWALLW